MIQYHKQKSRGADIEDAFAVKVLSERMLASGLGGSAEGRLPGLRWAVREYRADCHECGELRFRSVFSDVRTFS